jgi:hypothetical protein
MDPTTPLEDITDPHQLIEEFDRYILERNSDPLELTIKEEYDADKLKDQVFAPLREVNYRELPSYGHTADSMLEYWTLKEKLVYAIRLLTINNDLWQIRWNFWWNRTRQTKNRSLRRVYVFILYRIYYEKKKNERNIEDLNRLKENFDIVNERYSRMLPREVLPPVAERAFGYIY